MSSQDTASTESLQWAYFYFGLIVTGETEQGYLPKLFKSLKETGGCKFEVIQTIGQRDPRTSSRPRRNLKVLGTNQSIPPTDWEEIGLPAIEHVNQSGYHFVILIDDLEYRRRDQALLVFDRYRTALDIALKTLKHRASVHFLVNMLEAYYFADAQAINAVLGTALPDHEGDVETIRNPKGNLRQMYPTFGEIEHGGRILDQIDIERVLSHPDTCASLRTLFAWCVKVLAQHPNFDRADFEDKYKLHDGKLSEITRTQLDNL